ncbi:MAG: 1-acyl-sn-glycerol-3-phosphate acyltransferase [Oscillospiraceae bacterium]|jgi:1-acyl-sn-glycerol-3-phosphate acyltransferase|nr:1-acyl-sn-glycerol-3-phosphate acyltransferase [Oscillospiraceae bacterium]
MFYTIVHTLLRAVFRLVFRPRFYGRENIPEGAAVVCANHTASTDPVFLAIAIPCRDQVHFMAKAELLKNPFQRLLLKGLGVFAVRRGHSDLAAVKRAFTLLKAGHKVGMFPEGHRVQADEQSQVKTGAAMLAVRAGVPFLPVYISPGRKRLFSRVDVVIGSPYLVEGKKLSSERYMDIAEELMRRILSLEPQCHA